MASAPADLRRPWRADILAGFRVFLIALPLCLGISLASGYPAVAGVYTAVIGGIVCSFISNSELTIKGPAAGLIVIAVGAVTELGSGGTAGSFAELTKEQALGGYRMALGIGVAAGVIQILFGLFRAGKLGDFFPQSAVHGMLAAIGVVVIAKQFPLVLGVTDIKLGDKSAGDGPADLLLRVPAFIGHLNPVAALIGAAALLVLFGLPFVRGRVTRAVPGPMLVLLIALPLSFAFAMTSPHAYTFNGREFSIAPEHVIVLPEHFLGGLTFPDFSGLTTAAGIKYVIMFALIGSLESLFAARAIDLIDPWKRKTDLDRDLLAVGLANTCSALVGGLPMISAIVRSKANIDNGARTRRADLFHSLFLLACLAAAAPLLRHIPTAVPGAMLVYAGFRLASPREFLRTYQVGKAQLAVFMTTVLVTLATDPLVGIASGVVVEFLLQFLAGVELRHAFRPAVHVERPADGPSVIHVRSAAVFSNWLALKEFIERESVIGDVAVDLSESCLVDHTVMERLHELGRDLASAGSRLTVTGLENHRPVSGHPRAARKKPAARWPEPQRAGA